MKIVSAGYSYTPGFSDPVTWLKRIDFYTGILEQLALYHEVHSIEQIRYQGSLHWQQVNYHFLNGEKSRNYFPVMLHRYIGELKPDVVLINGLIFPLQVMQLRWKLGRKVKIILLHRGEKPYRGARRWVQRLADRCIDAYLFVSAEFGTDWISKGNITASTKIYEVMQASSVFRPKDKLLAKAAVGIQEERIFLWVGRLDANKDPLTVVKAFMQFARLEPGAVLYMICQADGLLDKVKELIHSDAGAAGYVKLVGKVSHDALQNWYSASDFIISGSHHEGSGIAVCEAMSCGCIPIVTDIISFRKMTGAGTCGLLYEPGSTAALLQALVKTSTLDIAKESARCLEQFNTVLSFEAIAKKINAVVKSLDDHGK